MSKRIEEHLKKQKKAEESKNPELVEYYRKEIENLRRAKEKKERMLKK